MICDQITLNVSSCYLCCWMIRRGSTTVRMCVLWSRLGAADGQIEHARLSGPS